MLTIAVPKGALYDDSAALLRSAGIDVPDDVGRKLAVVTSDGTQLLFLRPSDVPAYVEFGAADCGIVGKDVLWETDRMVSELSDLGFGYCRLCVAARRIDRYHEGAPFPTFLRVATKFERSAEAYFAERDLPVTIRNPHVLAAVEAVLAGARGRVYVGSCPRAQTGPRSDMGRGS